LGASYRHVMVVRVVGTNLLAVLEERKSARLAQQSRRLHQSAPFGGFGAGKVHVPRMISGSTAVNVAK
jgi:hypothetical protein